MSRIQDILNKAERDGTVRRIRTVADPIVAAGLAAPDAVATVVPPPAPLVEELRAAPVAAPLPPVPRPRSVGAASLDPSLVAALAPHAATAEQYRALRTRIVHADHGSGVRVVLVTSPGRGEGKSVTVANLGLAMAQEYQQRICIVDANLRDPQLHRLFGLPGTPGLADVLAGRAALEDALVAIDDLNITVLPAGEPAAHPAELLGTVSMRRTFDALRSTFDRVVIDAPAATPLADVGILAPQVDSVLLVVRAGMTKKPSIQEAINSVEPGKLLGVVFNAAA